METSLVNNGTRRQMKLSTNAEQTYRFTNHQKFHGHLGFLKGEGSSSSRVCRVRNLYLGFVALVVLPNEFAAVHAALVRVAHVVVGSGMLRVQTLPEQVIFYFY